MFAFVFLLYVCEAYLVVTATHLRISVEYVEEFGFEPTDGAPQQYIRLQEEEEKKIQDLMDSVKWVNTTIWPDGISMASRSETEERQEEEEHGDDLRELEVKLRDELEAQLSALVTESPHGQEKLEEVLGQRLRRASLHEKPVNTKEWLDVSDEEIEAAQRNQVKPVLKHVAITLASVVGFVLIAYCFLKDPVSCVLSFGTGCPCCLFCVCCVRKVVMKYLDPKSLMKNKMNKYMPGIIVHEDGTIENYEMSEEEATIMMEIFNILK